MREATERNKLDAILKAGQATENCVYLIIGEKRYRHDGKQCSKTLKNQNSSLYINTVASTTTQATPRTTTDKLTYAIHHNGAKLETITAKKGRPSTIFEIDGKEPVYELHNSSKRLRPTLTRVKHILKQKNNQEVIKICSNI